MSLRGYEGSAWVRPRITPPPPPPPPPPPTIISYTPVAPVVVQPIRGGTTFIPYYGAERIFKDIKVVTDLRQSGTERGEVQTGGDAMLGPGDTMKVPTKIAAPQQNNLVPIALAIAAFVFLGG